MGIRNRSGNNIKLTRRSDSAGFDHSSGIKMERFVSSFLLGSEKQVLLDAPEGDPKDMQWIIVENPKGTFRLLPRWTRQYSPDEPLLESQFSSWGQPLATVSGVGVETAMEQLLVQLPNDAPERARCWRKLMETPLYSPLPENCEAYLPWTEPEEIGDAKKFRSWLLSQPGMENLPLRLPKLPSYGTAELRELSSALYDFNELFPGIVAGLQELNLSGLTATTSLISGSSAVYESCTGKLSISAREVRKSVSNPAKIALENVSGGSRLLSTCTARGLLTHELSHALHHALMTSPEFRELRDMDMVLSAEEKEISLPVIGRKSVFGNDRVSSKISQDISYYAGTDGLELFAETLSELLEPDSRLAGMNNLAVKLIEEIIPMASEILHSKSDQQHCRC